MCRSVPICAIAYARSCVSGAHLSTLALERGDGYTTRTEMSTKETKQRPSHPWASKRLWVVTARFTKKERGSGPHTGIKGLFRVYVKAMDWAEKGADVTI